MNPSTTKSRILRIAAVIIWLLLWQVVSLFVAQELLLPSPIGVLHRLGELSVTQKFWLSIGNSFLKIVFGFLVGAIVGVIISVIAWRFAFVEIFLQPVLSTVKATPVASFIILALVWIKTSKLSIFISFLVVFPIIYSNMLQGLRSVDRELLEMAKVFRLSRWKKFRFIYLPATTPPFLAAIMSGVGFAWKSGIAAEVLATPANTIGKSIYESKIYLETTDLFAWTLTVIVLSIFLEKSLIYTARKVQTRMNHIQKEAQHK